MAIDFLIKTFQDNKNKDAIVWNDEAYNYSFLLDRILHYQQLLANNHISPGTITILEGEFSPNTVALFLALIQRQCILVPMTPEARVKKREWQEISQGEVSFFINDDDQIEITRHPQKDFHELFDKLRKWKHPGLILFSSGTTGKSKAVVHDFLALLDRFKKPRQPSRTIAFLLFDHMGGIDTLFHTLSNGGCIITCKERSPDKVLQAIEKFRAELLPTSPTFINLMLLSESYNRYDLRSLKAVTYGTEPMPESTLLRFNKIFPQIKMLQTYGMSEVGVLKSKSKDSGSLWVKIGGEGIETRVVDGILQVKTASTLLGYLNAPNPITEDGWFVTGDSVIVDGPYMKILGRQSDIISVGGEKVYPAEVESVIQEVDNVAESTVYGEKNPVVGNIVCARIRLRQEEDQKVVARRIKKYCGEKLQNYKVPMKITFNQENQYSTRFKKNRHFKTKPTFNMDSVEFLSFREINFKLYRDFALREWGNLCYQSSLNYIHWLYKENPCGSKLENDFLLGMNKGSIIACIHKMRLNWNIHGEIKTIPTLHNLMVSEKFRHGLGFTFLMRSVMGEEHALIPGVAPFLAEAYHKLKYQQVNSLWYRKILTPVKGGMFLGLKKLFDYNVRPQYFYSSEFSEKQDASSSIHISFDPSDQIVESLVSLLNQKPMDQVFPHWSVEQFKWRFFSSIRAPAPFGLLSIPEPNQGFHRSFPGAKKRLECGSNCRNGCFF